MYRFFWLIISLVSFTSCKDFMVEKLELSQLQSERLSEIDWDVVDGLPIPPGCNALENAQAFSPCLMNFMRQSLVVDQQLLRNLRTEFGDTLHLNLVVDTNGAVQLGFRVKHNKIESSKEDLMTQFESLISTEPWIPGIKRGVPVQVAFDYDLVLKDAN
jgi:hypothetical protein